jgi:hypothetical protein
MAGVLLTTRHDGDGVEDEHIGELSANIRSV